LDHADSIRRPQPPHTSNPARRYRRSRGAFGLAPGAGLRAALMSWAAMKSASLTSAGCAGLREMTHPSGRFHRCRLLCPRLTSAGSVRSRSVRCRFHTCRPVYRGLDKIVVTVPSVHPAPVRCRFRPGSADDGQGTPASFSARAIRATEWPASRRAKIHRTGAAAQRTIRAAAGSRRAGQGGRAGTAGRRLP